MEAPVRAVILDLDGTLLDHVGAVTGALTAWLPELGHTTTDDHLAAWFRLEDEHFPAWREGRVTFAEQRRMRLRDFLPLLGRTVGDDDDLDGVFAGYLAHYQAHWAAFDDVEALLAGLARRGLRTAVLSNGTRELQAAKLRAIGIHDRVGALFTPEDVGAAKPDPSAYRAVCAALGVAPGESVHVGDLHDLDVVAPRLAGLRAVHLDRHGRGPQDEPLRITSLRDLPGLLNL